MRRWIAAILLAVFCSFVAVPVVSAWPDPDQNLPACCRKHGGKRCHCAMMMAYLASRGPGTKMLATAVPCPDCPSTAPGMAHFDLGLSAGAASFAQVVSHPAIHAQTEARGRIALDRAWRKRGPPVSLFL